VSCCGESRDAPHRVRRQLFDVGYAETGTTTVVAILSRHVCFSLSHSAHRKPSSTVAFEKQALRRPRGAIEFDRYQAEGVQVMIEAGIRLPAHLRVDRPRWKLHGVAVYFDGDRFGARGEFVGSGGG
jgi:hypothetical protein